MASVNDDYGVLTKRRLLAWIGALVVVAAAVAALLGFLGAGHGVKWVHFDWSLAAVAGTAVGTVLLAGFTGALAWTTSGDVRATIRLADATQEQQRARDRPIVVVRVDGVTQQYLDQASREVVSVLVLWIKNVGLGPALDLRLRATYKREPVPTEEVIAVLEIGEAVTDRPISLAGLDLPEAGFVLDDFVVTGDCTDRTRGSRHDAIVLGESGLRDQMRVAQAAANLRAWLVLMPGANDPPRSEDVQYRSAVQNNGPAEAIDVRLQLVDDATQDDYGHPTLVGPMAAHSQANVTVTCPYPHGRMGCRITWRDGRGPQSTYLDGAYQPLGLTLPPDEEGDQ